MSADPTVSFEFFPPRNESREQKLINEVLPHMAPLNPEFVSVTYGAGGSTKEGTLSAIRKLGGKKIDRAWGAWFTLLYPEPLGRGVQNL